MNGWITFWTWVYIISCSLGGLMVLILLPLGVRDLVRLYHLLNAHAPTDTGRAKPHDDRGASS